MGSLGDKWQFVRRNGAQGAVYHIGERRQGKIKEDESKRTEAWRNTELKKSGGRDEGAAGGHVMDDEAKEETVTQQKEETVRNKTSRERARVRGKSASER